MSYKTQAFGWYNAGITQVVILREPEKYSCRVYTMATLTTWPQLFSLSKKNSHCIIGRKLKADVRL